jgi:DNA-binding winged helix-turn-helix (wHTH) protein
MRVAGSGHRRLPPDFRLGEWLVQPSLDRIRREDCTVHLRPKLMDLLVHLARHAGAVIAKDDIIAGVWDKEFMAESVLTRSITELRQALGDSADEPRYIETIAKRGYRVIASVERLAAASPSSGQPSVFRLVMGERVIALQDGENNIGRDPASAVRIDSIDVSRRHARIVVASGRAVLEDLGSRNGTYLRGERLEAASELANGDEIGIGAVLLVFRVVGIPGTTATASPPGAAST